MSIKNILFSLCVILCLANQVNSLRCYANFSKSGEDYYNKSMTEEEYVRSKCTRTNNLLSEFKIRNIISSMLSDVLRVPPAEENEVSEEPDSYDCIKMKISPTKEKDTIRMCIPKNISYENVVLLFDLVGQSVDYLYRCDSDFCNSSGTLRIGYLSFMSSLLLIFFRNSLFH